MEEAVAPHRAFLYQMVGQMHSPFEASMDNALLDAIGAAAGTRLAFSNGWRYGVPIMFAAHSSAHFHHQTAIKQIGPSSIASSTS